METDNLEKRRSFVDYSKRIEKENIILMNKIILLRRERTELELLLESKNDKIEELAYTIEQLIKETGT